MSGRILKAVPNAEPATEDLSDLGRLGGWSDRIASIRVFGRTSVIVYRDIGFRPAPA